MTSIPPGLPPLIPSITNPPAASAAASKLGSFERILSREPFTGLKAILDNLSRSREALCEAANGANSYEDLLAKLGYRLTLTKQIHVQDAFTRLGAAGGIKVVLPYFDIPTHSSFPTLVNFDATVTTTSESASFFNKMVSTFRTQWSADSAQLPA